MCFVIILPVLYLLAIFTNDDKTDKKELSHSNEPHSQVVPKVTKIRTQGLARYIGVSNLAFSADFGRPIQVITSAENIEWQSSTAGKIKHICWSGSINIALRSVRSTF